MLIGMLILWVQAAMVNAICYPQDFAIEPPKPKPTPRPRPAPFNRLLVWGIAVVLVWGMANLIFADVPYRPADPWAAFNPQPAAPAAPVAIPASPTIPSRPNPPPLPVAPPVPQGQGWGVDDLSGPWPSAEIQPASGRAERLLRRFHAAQGLEVGE